MQDRAVVAAVIAGDTDGFGAAYDQHAAALYARCHAVLPEPEAAEAVLDTFLVAAAKLDELRDPDRFGSWLHAVARNECLRRLGPGATIPAPADQGGEPQELPPPPGLRSQVLTACADNSPAGRAHRMSVAHRAGAFGPAGFPKAIGPSGPSWWRRVRRHPGVVAAVATAAALAMTAGITVAMTAGASHRPQASAPRLDAGVPGPVVRHDPRRREQGAVAGALGLGLGPPRHRRRTATSTGEGTRRGTTSAAASPSAEQPRALRAATRVTVTVTVIPSTATSPALGYLTVAPIKLVLTSVSGKPVSGSFVLTAAGGPVPSYAVGVATLASKVKVTPAGGSLRVNGSVKVTVTVTSKVALSTYVIVEPGNLTVTVVYKLKP